MAGKYGSASVSISLDDAAGGTPRVISGYVTSDVGAKIIQAIEETHGMGDAWIERTPTGIGDVEIPQFEGFWDTTATTGPHAVFLTPDSDPNGGTRTLVLGFGDSKTFTCETRLTSYEVLAQRGNLTKFRAQLVVTGQPVGWA